MLIPFGGLRITGGADTLALSTTAAKMVSWSASGGANSVNSGTIDGDPAVIPDKANNRIKVNSPGLYFVQFNFSGTADGAQDIIAKLRKNGTAYGEGLVAKQRSATTKWQLSFSGFVQVTAADNPETLPTFADPSSSGFAGAGGAPKTLSYLEVYLESGAGTPTVTFEEVTLNVIRVG